MNHTCRTVAGSFAMAVWLFVFLCSSFTTNASNRHHAKVVVSATSHQSDSPEHSTTPILLPEDAGTGLEKKEDAGKDDTKKCFFTANLSELVSIWQDAGVQVVQSFHFNQAIQQRISIPLFVLHHSWKSYLS